MFSKKTREVAPLARKVAPLAKKVAPLAREVVSVARKVAPLAVAASKRRPFHHYHLRRHVIKFELNFSLRTRR